MALKENSKERVLAYWLLPCFMAIIALAFTSAMALPLNFIWSKVTLFWRRQSKQMAMATSVRLFASCNIWIYTLPFTEKT